jgi:hypothetical protein
VTGARSLALALGAAACSGGAGGTDAAPADAGAVRAPPCPIAPGRTYTMQEYGFHPPGMGFDLDGDGTVDNELGFLAPIANQVIGEALDSGLTRYLFDIGGWDGAPADDAEVTMVSYAGIDADEPPDITNDFGGQGEFYVGGRDFDVDCNPLNPSRTGSVAGRVVYITADRWGLFVNNVGTVEFAKVVLEFTLAEDLVTATGELGAVMTICGLSRAYQPQIGAGTFLDLVLATDRDADIDVDGDGLEVLDYAGGVVTACTDGDGTVLPGPACICDPRIADGFSLGVYARGVVCNIAGFLDVD